VNFFIVIGILILTIAAINFVNLTTARAGIRAKEVGMRKIFGAVRPNLIYQFLSESTVFAAAAFILALVLVILAGPAFTSLTGKAIPRHLFHPLLIFLSAGATFLSLGILAGIYPAFYLSAFRPVRILKGTHAGEKGSGFFRKALVVFQFTFTIGLIACAGVIHSQFQYIQKKDLGFDQENIVYAKLNGDLKTKYEALKLELLHNPLIGNVSAGSNILTSGAMGFSDFHWEGKPESDDLSRKLNFGHTNVDVNFVSMMNMTILEGRDFLAGRNSDAEILINQAAAREMGIESPVGLSAHIPDAEEDGTIIGVLKDYHFTSLHQTIRPLVISVNPNMFNYLYVKLTPGDQFAALDHIREVCERIEPAFPCEIHFLDEELDNLYRSEKRMGSILNIFTGFALFVACLGLFGLVSFTTERRTREIGIRKVLGATAAGILRMISREYMFLILLANFAAWPLSYLIMKRWLQGFAYRIDMNPWIFIYAAGLTLLVGLFSIGLKSYRAAAANPADSLRSE
jgi:putative ABC transport system permease protein